MSMSNVSMTSQAYFLLHFTLPAVTYTNSDSQPLGKTTKSAGAASPVMLHRYIASTTKDQPPYLPADQRFALKQDHKKERKVELDGHSPNERVQRLDEFMSKLTDMKLVEKAMSAGGVFVDNKTISGGDKQ